MNQNTSFITQKPHNQFISTLVDYYFYIDCTVNELSLTEEFILPFPRITFGYFFNHPFLATNHKLKQSVSVNMAISRISTHKITVEPLTDKVRILGAHVRPLCLAHLTLKPIKTMPWLINTVDLFQKTATSFQVKIERCTVPEEMFAVVEKAFLDNILVRDLSLITNAVKLIDESAGDIRIKELAQQLNVSDRTIRIQFDNHIGCSPKEYIRLVKLKQVTWQMRTSGRSLTDIAHDNKFFDQAHLIHELKSITAMSPRKLRKEISGFRFLQF